MVADHTMTQEQQYNELFLKHPMPFHFKTVYKYQQQDPALLALSHQEPTKYVIRVLGNYQIICAQTKTGVYMCLTDAMLPKVIKYFHEVTAHNEGTS